MSTLPDSPTRADEVVYERKGPLKSSPLIGILLGVFLGLAIGTSSGALLHTSPEMNLAQVLVDRAPCFPNFITGMVRPNGSGVFSVNGGQAFESTFGAAKKAAAKQLVSVTVARKGQYVTIVGFGCPPEEGSST